MSTKLPATGPPFAQPAVALPFSPDVQLEGLDATLRDFWSWGFSNLLSNVVRSAFAEFIVARKLGVADSVRLDWNSFDLAYRGKRIEVKASAYLQTWPQRQLSPISFDIAPKVGWDALTGLWASTALRSTDCYVFCLYKEKDSAGRDPAAVADLKRWAFYVASLAEIDQSFKKQKTVSLKSLSRFGPITHEELKSRIGQKLSLR